MVGDVAAVLFSVAGVFALLAGPWIQAGNWRREIGAIQIHIGNYPSHTEGCVLVGTTNSENMVGNSTAAYQKLPDFVFGAGFKRADIRKAKPEFGTITVKFVDQTPGISGRV